MPRKNELKRKCVITILLEDYKNTVKTGCSITGAFSDELALYALLALSNAIMEVIEEKYGKCRENGNK